MAFEFNDLKGLLLVVFFAIPLAKSTNINCNGKPFHCLNSSHFMICVDLGSGVSVTIDDFLIPCPPTTVCDLNNIYECEFPKVELTPMPLHVIGVSAKKVLPSLDDKKTSSQIEVSTTLPSTEKSSVVTPLLGEITLPSKMEILENLKEEFADGNEKIFDKDSIIPTSTIGYDSAVVLTYPYAIDTTSSKDVNYNVQSTTETAINKANEMFITDNLKLIDTTTISNDMNAENTQFVTIKRIITDIPLDLMSTTLTPFKDIQQTIKLDKPPDTGKSDNNTSKITFQNNLTTSKGIPDIVEDSVAATKNILSTITNDDLPSIAVDIPKMNDSNTTAEGVLIPNTEILHEVFIRNQPVPEQSTTTTPITTSTQQLLETTEVYLRTTSASLLLDDIMKSRKSNDDSKPTLSTLIEHQEKNNNLISADNMINQITKSFSVPADSNYSNIKQTNDASHASNQSLSNIFVMFNTDNDMYANGNAEIKISERDVKISTDFINQNEVTSNIPITSVKKEGKLIMSNDTYYNKNVFNSEPVKSKVYNNYKDTTLNLNDKYSNEIASTPKNIPNFLDENKIALTNYEQISLFDVTEAPATKVIVTSRPELSTALPLNTHSTSTILPTFDELTLPNEVQTKPEDEHIGGTEFVLENDTILLTSTIRLLYSTYDFISTPKEPQLDNVNQLSETTTSIDSTTPSTYLRKYESNNVFEAVQPTVPMNSDLTESIVRHMTTAGYTDNKRLVTENKTATSLSEITTNTNNFKDSMVEKTSYFSAIQAEKQTTPLLNPEKYKTNVTELGNKNHILQTTPFMASLTTEITKISPSKESEIKTESIIIPTIATAEHNETNSSSDFTTKKVNNVNIIERNITSVTENTSSKEVLVISLNDTVLTSRPTTNITLTIDQISDTNGTRNTIVNKPIIDNKVHTLNETLDSSMSEYNTKTYMKQEVLSTTTLSPTLFTSPKLLQTDDNTLQVTEAMSSTKFETENPLLNVTEIINQEIMTDKVFTEKHANFSEIRYRNTLQIELPFSSTEKIEIYSGNRSTEAAVDTAKPNIPNLSIVTANKTDDNNTSKFIQRTVNKENTLVTVKVSGSTVEQDLKSKTSPNVLVSIGYPYIDDSRKMFEQKTNSITTLPKLRTELEIDPTDKNKYMILSDNLASSVKPDIHESMDSITSRKSYFAGSTVAYTDQITDNPLTKRVIDPASEVPFTIEISNSNGYNTTESPIFDEVILTETIRNISQFQNNKSHENVQGEYNLNSAKLSSLSDREQLNQDANNKTLIVQSAFQKDSINSNSAKLSSLSDREQLNQEAENNTFVVQSAFKKDSIRLDSAKLSSLGDRENFNLEDEKNTFVVQSAFQNESRNLNPAKLSSLNDRVKLNQEPRNNTFVVQSAFQKDSIRLNSAKLSSLGDTVNLNQEDKNNTFVVQSAFQNDSRNLNPAKLSSLNDGVKLNQEARNNTFVVQSAFQKDSIRLNSAKLSSLGDRENLNLEDENNTFVVQSAFQNDFRNLNPAKLSSLNDGVKLNQEARNNTFVVQSDFQKDSTNSNSSKLSSLNDTEQLNQNQVENSTFVRTQVNLGLSFNKDSNNNSFNQDKYEPLKLSLKVTSQIEQTTQEVISTPVSDANSVNNKSMTSLNYTNDTNTKMYGETETKFSKGSINISNDILVEKRGSANNIINSETNKTKIMKIDLDKNITERQNTVNVNVKKFSNNLQTFEAHANSSATQSKQMNDGQKVTTLNINNYIAATTDASISGSTFDCTNLTRGKYADNKDCRKFYICLGNLQAIIGTCPNGTVFSEINKQCTRNLSHCVRNNQFHCLDEGRFTDFLKDNIYYICVKHHNGFLRYKLECQNSYYLNKAIVKCVKKQIISSKSTSSTSENSQTNTDQNEETDESGKSENQNTDFECKKEGKFPFKGDCKKYFECSINNKNEYRRKIKTCSDDEFYDKDNNSCKSGESNEC